MTWSTFVVSCYLYLLEIKIIFKKSILFDLLLTKSAKTSKQNEAESNEDPSWVANIFGHL